VDQETLARFVVGESENLIDGPGRAGARSEIKFYVVFVLIKPGIEFEWFELHVSTSKMRPISIMDSAGPCKDDF
jgi:hypothetical protein